MSHSASDGIGNRLYLLIPLALPFSLSLSLALSHSTPPLIHLLRTLLNISPNPIFLPRRLPAFSLPLPVSPPFLSSQLPTSFLFSHLVFFLSFFNTHLRLPPLIPRAARAAAPILPIHPCDIAKFQAAQRRQGTGNVPPAAVPEVMSPRQTDTIIPTSSLFRVGWIQGWMV